MSVTVRLAAEADLDAITDLYIAVAAEGVWIGGEHPIDRAARRSAFADTIAEQSDGVSGALFVAIIDGRVVGSLGVHNNRNGLGELGMMVADGHRSAGVGRALLDACVDWARSAGVHKLSLQHWPWNTRARKLYERAGFVEEGYFRRHWKRKDGSLWDGVQMGLILDHDAPGHDERAVEPPRPRADS